MLLCRDNNPDDNGMTTRFLPLALLLLATAGCQAFDRAAGTDASGVYPAQRNGTAVSPPGTAATCALDRAAGTDASGAYPAQQDGTPGNPPGTAISRIYDRATGNNTSGAYPANTRSY